MASSHDFSHDGSDRDDGVGGGDDDGAQDSGGARDNEFYSLLNVSRNATDAEITAAYKKFARLYHPDKHMVSRSLMTFHSKLLWTDCTSIVCQSNISNELYIKRLGLSGIKNAMNFPSRTPRGRKRRR